MDGLTYVPFNSLVLTFVHGYCVAINQCDSNQVARQRADLLNS